MSLTNPNTPISEQDLHNFYHKIKPYLGINEMPQADLAEIMDPPPAVANQMPVLFDETGAERQVGWYKNSAGLKKPVYEKDFNVDSISQGSWTVVNHNIDNFERAVSIFATGFKSSDSTYWVWNGYRDTSSCGIMVTDATRFQIYTGSGSQWSSAKVTIQYTKTTDEFA